MMSGRATGSIRETQERVRLPRLVLALVGFVFALALLPAAGAAASGKTIPDVKILFNRAVKIVRADPCCSQAVMLEADGITSGPLPTRSASGIDEWRFVFDNGPSNNPAVLSAFVNYGPPPDEFGPVSTSENPFLQDRQIPKAPAMTLKRAVKLLEDVVGLPFFNVTLRNPLSPTITYNPLYIFQIVTGQFVAVDTVTGRVFPFS